LIPDRSEESCESPGSLPVLVRLMADVLRDELTSIASVDFSLTK
jgi:hypothetical protein